MENTGLAASLGVVIVAYCSEDVILDCLETLLAAAAADGTALRVVVVDNASPDGTVAAVEGWMAGTRPYVAPADLPFPFVPLAKPLAGGRVEVLREGANGGFAAGVNIGLAHLFADPAISRVWVLNPDSVVPPGTPSAFASHDPGPFALMGGRVIYYERPDTIQIDGGRIDWRTGVTHNLNQYARANSSPPDLAAVDFVSGASMVVSRAHWQAAGPMAEDYFLYYEEVDWALCRGDLPLAYCAGGLVYHRGGTAIGSPVPTRPATPFALYFRFRARHRFVRRHLRASRTGAWLYTLAKVAQYALRGWPAEAFAVLAGARDAAPSAAISARLAPEAAARAFAPVGGPELRQQNR